MSQASEPPAPEPATVPQFDPVQRAVLDVLSHYRGSYGVTTRQLASRCQASCQAVYRAVCELERLGYVYCQNRQGSLVAMMCPRRETVTEPSQANPIAAHIRVVLMAYDYPVTQYLVSARCCELSKDLRRQVVKELTEAGCLEPCFDHRGIPAFRATTYQQVEAGLTAIKQAKARAAGCQG